MLREEGPCQVRWEKYHTIWAIMIFGWITNYMVRSSLSPHRSGEYFHLPFYLTIDFTTSLELKPAP